ncbi:MAG TPA: hypothetical protein VGD71_21230, partial [Kribbella sp.]
GCAATGMHNETTRLLGPTGLAVVRVDAPHDRPVVHLITADEQARTCPDARWHCGGANAAGTATSRNVTERPSPSRG